MFSSYAYKFSFLIKKPETAFSVLHEIKNYEKKKKRFFSIKAYMLNELLGTKI
jgi:hypothetical protein